MKVENVKFYDNLSFEEYLLLPGWSYSKIKTEGKEWKLSTAKMTLGTNIHQYRLEPSLYKHEDIKIVKPVVRQIDIVLGSLSRYLKPEVAFTADFIYAGYRLKYKGRADLSIHQKIVIDLKVSEEKDPYNVITYFGYDKQLSGYALALGTDNALIFNINPKKPHKDFNIFKIPVDPSWWEDQIVKKGEPCSL